jgi:hypothetical protein
MRFAWLLICGVLALGVAAMVVGLGHHSGVELFRFQQSAALRAKAPLTLTGPLVAAQIGKAPEPVAAPKRTPTAIASCVARGGGVLGNPWSCAIRYRSGTRAHYTVQVQPSGYYSGTGTGIISGCCIANPTRD